MLTNCHPLLYIDYLDTSSLLSLEKSSLLSTSLGRVYDLTSLGREGNLVDISICITLLCILDTNFDLCDLLTRTDLDVLFDNLVLVLP